MYGTIQAVRENNKLAEVALCYTGDILDPARDKYDLKYYVNMAKELQNAGANIIAIKDMAGLLKPEAAYRLVSALKDAVDLPIHLHTHDGSGNAICTYDRAIDAGVDIVDVAYSAFAGGTSQPSMSTLYYALSGKDRQPDLDVDAMEEMSRYWATVRTIRASTKPMRIRTRKSTSMKCRAASSPTCASRPKPSASATAGTKSRRCTTRSA